MATKKKPTVRAKAKRPPRQFWITYDPETGRKVDDFTKEKDAVKAAQQYGFAFAGPYALQERVRQR